MSGPGILCFEYQLFQFLQHQATGTKFGGDAGGMATRKIFLSVAANSSCDSQRPGAGRFQKRSVFSS